jgi:hypothetical protein
MAESYHRSWRVVGLIGVIIYIVRNPPGQRISRSQISSLEDEAQMAAAAAERKGSVVDDFNSVASAPAIQDTAKPASSLTAIRGPAPNCPRCGAVLPTFRIPASMKEALWGGWTCPKCGCKVDKYGKELATNIIKDIAEQAREEDAYPTASRMIDVGAFLLLASGLFMPVARLGFRMMQLIDTDASLIFAGASAVGLFAALARHRRIVVISALVYGGFFAVYVVNFQEKVEEMRVQLRNNPFRGLAEAMIGLEWGCAVITLGVLAVLCSTVIVHRLLPSSLVRNRD